ncbi:hypothetical protein [Streptomyces sp. CB01881]|uniref:hypothetical protein n=1 Tax=Streptomyces sp. CB01881 TaxID=2078691 RepID=UPI0011DF9F48|nr:hypothetical protein [Streptomyces sp. CB01881]TYC76590.1 hypothetical protein EH183_03000 [Streptomyces sp. CB01881]
MTTPKGIPTKEQYDAAREFVITRQRRSRAKLASCDPDIATAFEAWSQLVDRRLARTSIALKKGEFDEAARSWAVVIESISAWVTHPEFPASLYADAYADRYGG